MACARVYGSLPTAQLRYVAHVVDPPAERVHMDAESERIFVRVNR